MKGFSIIELIVVVAIIGILAAIGIMSYSGYTSTTKKSNAKNNLRSIYMMQEEYKANNGFYLTTVAGSSCNHDNISEINTKLFEGTKVLDESPMRDYKYCIANDSDDGSTYKAFAINISDTKVKFSIDQKNNICDKNCN